MLGRAAELGHLHKIPIFMELSRKFLGSWNFVNSVLATDKAMCNILFWFGSGGHRK